MGLASSLALAASGLALVATIGLTVAIASFSGDSSGGRAIEPSDVMHVGAAPVMPPAASVAPAADRPPAPPACVPPPGANLVAPPPTPSPIVVDSTPGGATVVVDGVRIGKTPLVVPRPTGETRVRLELKRAGYRPEVLVLTASGSDVAVELKRAPARTVQRDWDSGVIR